jgi:hypothetical protein
MKIIAKTLLASSLCIFMAVPAHAGHNHDDGRLVDRMQRQHERIENGVESGALTRKETRKLTKQKHKTRSMARKFRKDDVLTLKERRILNKRLNKASNRIWVFKHNDSERHTDRYNFRDTYQDVSWNHRYNRRKDHHDHNDHNKHNRHHEDGRHSTSCFSDSQSWPRYGLLSW